VVTRSLYWQLYEATEAHAPSPPEIVDKALASEDAFERWMGCKAAGVSPDVRYLPRLAEAATGTPKPGEPDLPSIAIWALARFPRDVIDPLWTSWAEDSQAPARRAAADLLGEARITDGGAVLMRLLNDGDWDVFLWAALSLSKIPDVGYELLLAAMRKSNDAPRFLVIADALLKADFQAATGDVAAEAANLPAETRDAVVSKLQELLIQNRP
jgi:hypothetical protein